jgi:propanediol dehydratase small subunit
VSDKPNLDVADYPLAEQRPDLVRGRRGKGIADISLKTIMAGEATMQDLTITPEMLRLQADIARAAGRAKLADNLERAAEMADVPQDVIMRVYEILRPGRATGAADLAAIAADLRATYKAERLACFIEEAAAVYEKRGLFAFRY